MDQELLKIKSELEKIDNISAYAEIIVFHKEGIGYSSEFLEVITGQFKATVTNYCGFDLTVRLSDGEIDEYTPRTGCIYNLTKF